MTMTDPIADMLTRIRNANSVHHDKVEIPCSKIKTAIAEILKNEVHQRFRSRSRKASRCDPRTSEIWSEQGTCYFRH